MANGNFYITEYAETLLGIGDRAAPFPVEPALAHGHLVISGAAALYGPLNPATQVVRLATDSACSILFSFTGASATTVDPFMPVSLVEYRGVYRNSGLYISVIQNSGSAPTPSHDAQPLGMP